MNSSGKPVTHAYHLGFLAIVSSRDSVAVIFVETLSMATLKKSFYIYIDLFFFSKDKYGFLPVASVWALVSFSLLRQTVTMLVDGKHFVFYLTMQSQTTFSCASFSCGA